MVWRAEDPQGNEAAKIKWEIVPYTRGVVLDLGCGPHKAFPHFIGIDSGKDRTLFGIEMQPDLDVDTCERLDCIETATCDAVFSSHLLEHITDTVGALTEWWRVLQVGGHLVLYLPHQDLYPRIGTPGANPDHVHDFEPLDITEAMRRVVEISGQGFDLLVRQKRSAGTEYSFLMVFQKRAERTIQESWITRSQPRKTACVVRYGGFGDLLQAANVLPALKRAGYHVTMMTTPKGQEILQHDPHVDAWFLQDNDQVPNAELPEFWAAQARHFDTFINLCESVEGTLLAMPGRANYAWPKSVRDRHLNLNYLEFTAELAGVPYASEARFYPTPAEIDAAQARVSGSGFTVVYALAGSSLHKFWPGQDALIARLLLERPDCKIFLVGDAPCKMLEIGWEKEPRVVCLSGELTIRDTLALAQQADVVIGAETGVLNAVAFESNRKVVLLSHSSVENLTKHWVNTASIEPLGVSCYPCHRLHYTREHCPQDSASGAALCQRAILPEHVWQGLLG